MKRFTLAALVVAGATALAAPAASVSPVGLWRANWDKTRVYRWVSIAGGFEERSMTPHRLKGNKCLVRAGDPVYRYIHAGHASKIWEHQWADKDCATSWKLLSYTVTIAVTRTRLAIHCSDKPGKVCWSYTRVAT